LHVVAVVEGEGIAVDSGFVIVGEAFEEVVVAGNEETAVVNVL
jgi:hypothetical protein